MELQEHLLEIRWPSGASTVERIALKGVYCRVDDPLDVYCEYREFSDVYC